MHLEILDTGLLANAAEDAAPNLVVTIGSGALPAMVRGEDALMREIGIEGNADLASAVQYLFRHLRWDMEEDLSRMFNPVLRGWINYYGCFYKSALYPTLRHMNRALVHWVRRKYKRFNRHRRRAEYWLGRGARREPKLCAHGHMGSKPAAG